MSQFELFYHLVHLAVASLGHIAPEVEHAGEAWHNKQRDECPDIVMHIGWQGEEHEAEVEYQIQIEHHCLAGGAVALGQQLTGYVIGDGSQANAELMSNT